MDGTWRVCQALIDLQTTANLGSRYLIFSASYENDPQLRFSIAVLYVFVVILLIAGYSLGVILCFFCRSLVFQAESVFLYDVSQTVATRQELT
jgi:hypothetical protein